MASFHRPRSFPLCWGFCSPYKEKSPEHHCRIGIVRLPAYIQGKQRVQGDPKDRIKAQESISCLLYQLKKCNTSIFCRQSLPSTAILSHIFTTSLDGSPFNLTYLGSVEMTLWGNTFKLTVLRKHLSVQPKELERLKKKGRCTWYRRGNTSHFHSKLWRWRPMGRCSLYWIRGFYSSRHALWACHRINVSISVLNLISLIYPVEAWRQKVHKN